MSEQNHISQEQLRLLSIGGLDEQRLQNLADHVESCTQCKRTLDSTAAAPEVWGVASKLKPEQALSDMTKRIAAIHPCKDADEPVASYSVDHLFEAPSHPEMMGRIGNYDIEREVGRGGMGVVFKAFDTELNRPLAIKILSPRLAENGTARQRFAREARAAAAVIHPNVVAIYGVNSSHETPYLVMPYVAGPSLQRLIDEHGPLEEKEIVRMTLQVAAGLAAAHSQGLVHRDIKPANILVESDVSRVLVTDFGLARAVGDMSMTQTGYFAGTPNYMSPEQALGKRIDARSDLFSLGSVMYFMATGHMPFRAESPLSVLNRISNDQPAPVQEANNDISKTLSDIINRLLAKHPDDRFQSSGELHEFLEQYLVYLHQPDVSKPPAIAHPRLRKSLADWESEPLSKVLLTAVVVTILFGFAFGKSWLAWPGFTTQPGVSFSGSVDEFPVTTNGQKPSIRHGAEASRNEPPVPPEPPEPPIPPEPPEPPEPPSVIIGMCEWFKDALGF